MDRIKLFDNVYALGDTRLLYIDGASAIVAADLHLGFEEDMARQGFFIPRAQLRKAVNTFTRVVEELGGVEKVIIAGDLKHAFDRLLRQERYEVRELLDLLLKRLGVRQVVVIRGNHDNYLPIVLKDYSIELKVDYLVKVSDIRIYITHGHLDLELKGDLTIIGHEHPSIGIVDELGLLTKVHCYLEMPSTLDTRIIVLPAMGAYQAGNKITLNREDYLSPIVKKYGVIEEAEPIAVIEGTGLLELPPLIDLFSSMDKMYMST